MGTAVHQEVPGSFRLVRTKERGWVFDGDDQISFPMSFVDSMLRSLRRMAGHIYGIYGPMSSLIKPLLYESYGNAAILASPICLGMFGRCFSS